MHKHLENSPVWVQKTIYLFDKCGYDKINIYAAQAAFYFIVSAVPFMIFLLSILRFFIPMTQLEFLALIQSAIPNSLKYWALNILRDIYTDSTISLTSFAVITTLWAASKSTFALSDGLLEIYENRHHTTTIKNRLVSIFFTLVLVIILIGTLLLIVFSKPLVTLIESHLPYSFKWLISILNLPDILSFAVICFVFTIMYKLLGYSKRRLIEHLPGAVISSLGWLIYSWIFQIYVNNFSKFNVTYGSLASIIVMMLWLKFCMTIFLFGGEVNFWIKTVRQDKINRLEV